jgi:hypothetical protein
MFLPSLIFLIIHPRTIEINRKSATLMPMGNSLIFFTNAIIGTYEIKNNIPISTLNKVNSITGNDAKKTINGAINVNIDLRAYFKIFAIFECKPTRAKAGDYLFQSWKVSIHFFPQGVSPSQ